MGREFSYAVIFAAGLGSAAAAFILQDQLKITLPSEWFDGSPKSPVAPDRSSVLLRPGLPTDEPQRSTFFDPRAEKVDVQRVGLLLEQQTAVNTQINGRLNYIWEWAKARDDGACVYESLAQVKELQREFNSRVQDLKLALNDVSYVMPPDELARRQVAIKELVDEMHKILDKAESVAGTSGVCS